jgi:nitrogen fixation/metabolism regulation signal transduction histidine kinase
MLALVLIIGQQARLFSVISVSMILVLLILELFRTLSRTNRIVESLLESVAYNDYNKTISDKAADLGFKSLADSAQEIIRAIASARIEKETQYQYLQTILDHIHTGVITLNEKNEPQLINPIALNIIGLYTNRNPSWKDIETKSPEFAELILSIGNEGRELVNLSNASTGKKLLVLLNTVKIGKSPVRIITFQDIEPEIEQKEMESWQTISRIMAHEIMNSLTPLASLTETGIMLLEKNGTPRSLEELSQETVQNLYTALKTISDRNLALTRFIENYRQLSRLPLPNKKEVQVSNMIRDIGDLYAPQFKSKSISISINPGPLKHIIYVDEAQVKQVMINLIKNAIEAIEIHERPSLSISAKRILNHLAIEISDNGPGIPDDVLQKIFVPFYSTKADGSGIGLSLSRQIIRNHGGQLSVKSMANSGTTFTVSLPIEND